MNILGPEVTSEFYVTLGSVRENFHCKMFFIDQLVLTYALGGLDFANVAGAGDLAADVNVLNISNPAFGL